jgi:thiol-disulfide isomerase/thioredoxin
MKRKGAFHFPPPPPHPELPSPATSFSIPVSDIIDGGKFSEWERPNLSDYACDHRTLETVPPSVVLNLASTVKHRLGTDTLRPEPPLHITDSKHFEKVFENNPGRLFVVDFYATWCGPCKVLAPAFRRLSMQTPTVIFLKVMLS